MPKRKLTKPLGHPVFRRLGTSYAINELGDWMGIVALSVLVFDRTGSALATAALFLGTRFLPALLAPIVVARVEQPPPRFALPVIYCGEAAAFAALALLSGDGFSLAAVVALAAIDGTLALTGRSLTRAVVVTLLEPRGELRDGNALLNIALTISAALGPAMAGLIIAGFGVQTALLLDAISFYVIAWLLLTAGPLPHAKPEEGQTRERVRAGIAYLREQTNLRRLLIAQGTAFVFFAAVIPIEVVYAKETLGTSDSGYGIMLASWGAGMVAGSLVFASAQKVRLPVLLFFSTLAVGVGYLGLAAAPTLAAACGASVVGGAGNGVQWVSAISAVQELTAERMQARVMSVLWSIGAAMPGVGYALGALVAVALDPRATFLIAGLGVLAIALLAALLLGTNWLESRENGSPEDLDAGDEIMVELIPVGESPVRPF
ncbi:MAG TPA: MFS transporter [Solirubrobacterales bacterium]|jgi:predicted MFS family arabinose efflux permease|nr:MFS transporter [Solirubrobacterales bacterium]